MAPLEHEVRDGIVVVDEEPVHLAELMAIRRGDLARPPDLDLSLGDSVVGHGDVRVVVGRPGFVAEAADGAVVVVRLREHALDTEVPPWLQFR